MKIRILLLLIPIFSPFNYSFAQDIFEPNNGSSSPAGINCGNTYEAFIQSVGDVDWYSVQVNQSGTLSVALTSIPSNIDLNLEIYQFVNDQLKLIADDNNNNIGGGQNVTATAFINQGTYLIFIGDENNNGANNAESYTLNISCSESLFEINQTIDLAKPIPQDTCFEENIWGENECFFTTNEGDDDRDWFEVQINESGKLKATLTSVPTDIDLNLEIYMIENNQPKKIADDDYGNAAGGQDLTATTFINAGTYYIHIEDENNNRTNEETYNFCLNFTPNTFEINQTIDLATPIPKDTCFMDNIWGENECFSTTNDGDNDQDWFEVQINESGKLKATLTSVPTDMDLNLEIYMIENNQPKKIADDDYGNAAGGQDLTATTFINAGTYYIHIEDENNNRTNEETYNFCLNFTPNTFEINQTIDLATPIPKDTCFMDNIWGENECFSTTNDGDNDQDWFEVQINESGKLKATLTSVPSDIDLNLEIYMIENNQPKKIADDDIGNASGGLSLTATTFINAGRYYIHIEDENNNRTNEETYNFCLNFTPNAFEINQTIDLATPIPQDTCFEENIWGENECFSTTNDGDNDQDWFEVQINESGKLKATLTSVPSDIDLNLEIYMIENNQPKKIADDDIGNASGGLSLTATTFINAGRYYIHIEDENNNRTNEETYNFCLNFTPNAFEINQTIDLATPIPKDTCFMNNIWGENECFSTSDDGDNDQDWFEVQVEATCLLNVALTNVPNVLDLNFEIFQIINGQEVIIADDGHGNSGGGQELSTELAIEPGTYYIHVEDENNNSTIEESFTFCISCQGMMVNTDGLINPKLSITPNPTTAQITIQYPITSTPTRVHVVDLNGRHLSTTQSTTGELQLDLSTLPEGIYFVHLVNEEYNAVRKVLKSRR